MFAWKETSNIISVVANPAFAPSINTSSTRYVYQFVTVQQTLALNNARLSIILQAIDKDMVIMTRMSTDVTY